MHQLVTAGETPNYTVMQIEHVHWFKFSHITK